MPETPEDLPKMFTKEERDIAWRAVIRVMKRNIEWEEKQAGQAFANVIHGKRAEDEGHLVIGSAHHREVYAAQALQELLKAHRGLKAIEDLVFGRGSPADRDNIETLGWQAYEKQVLNRKGS